METGDKISMYFHFNGLVSESEETIHRIDENLIELKSEEVFGFIFDRKTGRCLNDNTFGGARRTITPC